MPITFEICCYCGKHEMRKEAELHYNQSQDVFYYAWRCHSCGDIIYEEVEQKNLKNVEYKKALCIWCHNWNKMAVEHNNKHGLKKNKIIFKELDNILLI